MESALTPSKAGETTAAHCERVRDLGSGTSFVARTRDGRLLAVQRFPTTPTLLLRAEQLQGLWHPNVARVREATREGEFVRVATDFVEGSMLRDVSADGGGFGLPLDVVLRILVDALNGLSALHAYADKAKVPLRLFHGNVGPGSLVIGRDGVSRLVSVLWPESAHPSPRLVPYLAPERLLGKRADARADLYGVGAILWEALSGERLFSPDAAAILAKHAAGAVPRARVPSKEDWASGLIDVAARALASSPGARFASAADMAGELRKIARARLALPARVAALLKESEESPLSLVEVEPGSVPPVPPAKAPAPIAIEIAAPRAPPLPPRAVTTPRPVPAPSLAAPLPPAPEASVEIPEPVEPGIVEARPRRRKGIVWAVVGACLLVLVLAAAGALRGSPAPVPPSPPPATARLPEVVPAPVPLVAEAIAAPPIPPPAADPALVDPPPAPSKAEPPRAQPAPRASVAPSVPHPPSSSSQYDPLGI